ncbi:hypothetical protein HYQ46_002503 [Verticillium longisporum]|nr:hypothetical protein HYQ46_002503 [Verticillium longisporum]
MRAKGCIRREGRRQRRTRRLFLLARAPSSHPRLSVVGTGLDSLTHQRNRSSRGSSTSRQRLQSQAMRTTPVAAMASRK